MAYDFDGVNDELRNANGVGGINVNGFTVALDLIVDSGTSGTMFMTASAISAGNFAFFLRVDAPTGGGDFRLSVSYNWTTDGSWKTDDDFTYGDLLRVAIKYNRGSTANDPTVAVNGSLFTVGSGLTESQTPIGSAKTGVDSVIMGENVGGGDDFDGKLSEAAIWSRELTDDELLGLSLGFSPDHYARSLQEYWPLVRNADGRMGNANLTVTGATVTAHPPMIYRRRKRLGVPIAVVGGAASRKMLLLGVT